MEVHRMFMKDLIQEINYTRFVWFEMNDVPCPTEEELEPVPIDYNDDGDIIYYHPQFDPFDYMPSVEERHSRIP